MTAPADRTVYLDHHAATPLCGAALAAMTEAASECWANPASVHALGRRARAYLEQARDQIAQSIGASAADVVLTAGGTEACNLGTMGLHSASMAMLVSSAIEHPAVGAAMQSLAAEGIPLHRLPVLHGVAPSPEELARVLGTTPALVSLQWVNHETGTLLPIAAYGEVVRRSGGRLMVDATQALGKVPIDVEALGVDALAIAAHKVGGPPGAGALWVRRGVELTPRVLGGAQERGRRAGSPDVLAHVGFGAACAAVQQRLNAMQEVAALRDRLEASVRSLGGVINADRGARVATACNASFFGWRSELLVAAMDLEGICVASGAACSSGLSQPSPVLLAMYPEEPWRAAAALRFGLGVDTGAAEVDRAVAALTKVLARTSVGAA